MKRLIIILLVIIFSIPIGYARDPRRGYRGFLEIENSVGRVNITKQHYDGPSTTERDADWIIGLATTHGYQFNPHCFVGAGLMLGLSGSPSFMIPLYADFRYDARFGKFTPYLDTKLGCEFSELGVYFSPTIGYRFNCGGKVNFNLGLGMTVRGWSEEVDKPNDFWNQLQNPGRYYTKHSADVLFSLRLGIYF